MVRRNWRRCGKCGRCWYRSIRRRQRQRLSRIGYATHWCSPVICSIRALIRRAEVVGRSSTSSCSRLSYPSSTNCQASEELEISRNTPSATVITSSPLAYDYSEPKLETLTFLFAVKPGSKPVLPFQYDFTQAFPTTRMPRLFSLDALLSARRVLQAKTFVTQASIED